MDPSRRVNPLFGMATKRDVDQPGQFGEAMGPRSRVDGLRFGVRRLRTQGCRGHREAVGEPARAG